MRLVKTPFHFGSGKKAHGESTIGPLGVGVFRRFDIFMPPAAKGPPPDACMEGIVLRANRTARRLAYRSRRRRPSFRISPHSIVLFEYLRQRIETIPFAVQSWRNGSAVSPADKGNRGVSVPPRGWRCKPQAFPFSPGSGGALAPPGGSRAAALAAGGVPLSRVTPRPAPLPRRGGA